MKVLTPGAVTPGLITDGAITEGAVAPGDITPGAIEDGAIDYSALVVPSPVVYGATKVFVALLPNGTPIALSSPDTPHDGAALRGGSVV